MKKLAALLILGLISCGKRGDPKPPVPLIPKAASDLVVTQRGAKVILTWSYPSLTTAGQTLASFRRETVYRYVEEMPTPVAGRDPNSLLPGDTDPTIPPAVAMFSKLPSIGPSQFLRLKQRLDSIESANSPDATLGAKLTFEDEPSFHSTDGRPVRLSYAIVTEGEGAQSALSNLAVIVPVDVPLPPSSLSANARAEGVVLSWSKPEATLTGGGKPFITGYNVFRSAVTQPHDLAIPINLSPVRAVTYTDVPPYGNYTYRVTAVAVTTPPRIESDPSNSVNVTFRDQLPPPPPTGLTALIETKAIRLVWDVVDVPDLVGYNVYRVEGAGHPPTTASKPILFTPKPLSATSYRDPASPGIAFFYQVTAVDKSGNESAPARTDWVVVPKTP